MTVIVIDKQLIAQAEEGKTGKWKRRKWKKDSGEKGETREA